MTERLGEYRLIEQVAVGGMAKTYRAQHPEFSEDICLKVMHASLSEDEDFIKMFIDEAHITSKLEHPNIVEVYDFGNVDEQYFLAMELVDGKDLKQVMERSVRRGTMLTPIMSARLIRDICLALDCVHSQTADGRPLNIIHRDISPHNIMVSWAGGVKLLDFGIAKAASRLSQTRAGAVKGKRGYMSPEQARGRKLDHRSDIFAVGIILHEILTCRRLFTGDSSFAVFQKILEDPIPRPRDFVPELPAELDRITMKALERDVNQRYANAGEMGADLERWMGQVVTDLDSIPIGGYVSALFDRGSFRLPQAPKAPVSDAQKEVADLPTNLFDAAPSSPDPTPAPAPSDSRHGNVIVELGTDDLDLMTIGTADVVDAPTDAQHTSVSTFSGKPAQRNYSASLMEESHLGDDLEDEMDAAPTMVSPNAMAELLGIEDKPEPVPEPAPPVRQPSPAIPDYGQAESTAIFTAPAELQDDFTPVEKSGGISNTLKIVIAMGVVALLCFGASLVTTVGIFIWNEQKSSPPTMVVRKPDPETSPDVAKGSEDESGESKKDDAEEKTPSDSATDDNDKTGNTAEEDEKTVEEEKTDEEGTDEEKADEEGADEEKTDEEGTDEEKTNEEGADEEKEDEAGSADAEPEISEEEAAAKAAEEAKRKEEARRKRIERWKKERATVSVRVVPWADVYINGKKAGRSPVKKSMKPGTYKILLKNSELRRATTKTITVGKGETKSVFHTFK